MSLESEEIGDLETLIKLLENNITIIKEDLGINNQILRNVLKEFGRIQEGFDMLVNNLDILEEA